MAFNRRVSLITSALLMLVFLQTGCSVCAAEEPGSLPLSPISLDELALSSEEELIFAPQNPDFLEYLDRQHEEVEISSLSESEHPHTGYIPPPVDLSHLQASSDIQALALESRYDLRDYGLVTPVKNQGNYGTCWAFASFASLESTRIPTFGVSDYSEKHMANLHGFDWDVRKGEGGNNFVAAAYLTRWEGPVYEMEDPYFGDEWTPSPIGLPERVHCQEVLFLPRDVTSIKQAVREKGVVYTSYLNNWSCYRNAPSYTSYYYDGNSLCTGGHAVAIVGWDDTFDRSQFVTAPPGNGAFICKNSWGTSWGDGGYFYLSYYDYSFNVNGYAQPTVFTAEPVTNYDNIYQYDPYGWTTSCNISEPGDGERGYAANVFTASGNEQVEAVGFYTPTTDCEYYVYIYRGPEYVTGQYGTFDNAGFHTVALYSPVQLHAGETFTVYLTLKTPGYDYPICIEGPLPAHSWNALASNATASPGESYVSSDGSNWIDISRWNMNVCLKAYTQSITTPDFDADILEYSIPEVMFAGNTYLCSAKVLNTGQRDWVPSDNIAIKGTTPTAQLLLESSDPIYYIIRPGEVSTLYFTLRPTSTIVSGENILGFSLCENNWSFGEHIYEWVLVSQQPVITAPTCELGYGEEGVCTVAVENVIYPRQLIFAMTFDPDVAVVKDITLNTSVVGEGYLYGVGYNDDGTIYCSIFFDQPQLLVNKTPLVDIILQPLPDAGVSNFTVMYGDLYVLYPFSVNSLNQISSSQRSEDTIVLQRSDERGYPHPQEGMTNATVADEFPASPEVYVRCDAVDGIIIADGGGPALRAGGVRIQPHVLPLNALSTITVDLKRPEGSADNLILDLGYNSSILEIYGSVLSSTGGDQTGETLTNWTGEGYFGIELTNISKTLSDGYQPHIDLSIGTYEIPSITLLQVWGCHFYEVTDGGARIYYPCQSEINPIIITETHRERVPDPGSSGAYKGIQSGNTVYTGEVGLNFSSMGAATRLVHVSNLTTNGVIDKIIPIVAPISVDINPMSVDATTGIYFLWDDNGWINGFPYVIIDTPIVGLDVVQQNNTGAIDTTLPSANGESIPQGTPIAFGIANNLYGFAGAPPEQQPVTRIEVTLPGGAKTYYFGGQDLSRCLMNGTVQYWLNLDTSGLPLGAYVAQVRWPSDSDFFGKGYDSNIVSFEITPSTTPLTADFMTNVTSGTAPLAVQFTDTSIGSPTLWSWNFGDDATSTEQHPVHTYTAPGNYSVSLTVTNAAGSDTTARADYITVSPASGQDILWDVPLSVTSGTFVQMLILGSAESATMEFDSGLDVPMPPDAPGAKKSVYFACTDPTFGQLSADYKPPVDDVNPEEFWTLCIRSDEPVQVTWDTTRLSGSELFLTWNNGTNTVVMKTTGGATLPAGSYSINISASTVQQIDLSLKEGWNLVSVPLSNATYTVPQNSILATYGYNPSTRGYETVSQITSLVPGEAYWIASGRDCAVTVTGTPVSPVTAELKPGWNLIGSTAGQNAFSSISITPAESWAMSFVYEYDPQAKNYVQITELRSGKGYWGAVTRDCIISLL